MTSTDGSGKTSRKLPAVSKRTNRLIMATLAVATSLVVTLGSHTAIAGSTHSFTEYVPVLRVEPVYRNITVREPQRICRPAVHNNHYQHRYDHNQHRYDHNQNHHRHQPRRSTRSHRSHNNGEVFVAGVIGGAIGRELSRSVNGRPSTGATIAGAIIGSAIANNAIKNHRRHDNSKSRHNQHNTRYFAPVNHGRDSHGHYRPNVNHNRWNTGHRRHNNRNRQHCSTTVQTRTERKQDGFNVTYRYRGHRYQTHTRQHPGDRLAITVTLDPQKR